MHQNVTSCSSTTDDSSTDDETSDDEESQESNTDDDNESEWDDPILAQESAESAGAQLSESNFSTREMETMSILSFMLRYNLTNSAGKDLLELLTSLFPDSLDIASLSYPSELGETSYTIRHYCEKCDNMYPIEDENVFTCATENCSGSKDIWVHCRHRLRTDGNLERCFFSVEINTSE